VTTVTSIRSTTFTLASDQEVVITRAFDAPRQLVFDAWTKPEHVPNWMLGPDDSTTMPVCEIDLRPGGAWHFVWRGSDGAEMEMRGVYQEVSPPERLVCTESWGDDWPETLNTLLFTEAEGRTTMTITVRYPSREARDAALAAGMSDGAALSYDRLARYVRTMA
jgi:uncharacterized protein YndB with AHSA1/START domain